MDKLEILKTLKKRLTELLPIVSKSFKTGKDLDKHYNENILLFQEYETVRDEIETLKWELKTPEEKQEYLEQRRLSKLKREGKLL